MRAFTSILGLTTFVTLYHPGEGIYEQFDKVMVIDDERCAYFGPREKARQYFLDLGFKDYPCQTSADYLSGCTDPNLDRFAEGRDKSNVPATPEQLEKVFRESSIHKDMMRHQRNDDSMRQHTLFFGMEGSDTGYIAKSESSSYILQASGDSET